MQADKHMQVKFTTIHTNKIYYTTFIKIYVHNIFTFNKG